MLDIDFCFGLDQIESWIMHRLRGRRRNCGIFHNKPPDVFDVFDVFDVLMCWFDLFETFWKQNVNINGLIAHTFWSTKSVLLWNFRFGVFSSPWSFHIIWEHQNTHEFYLRSTLKFQVIVIQHILNPGNGQSSANRHANQVCVNHTLKWWWWSDWIIRCLNEVDILNGSIVRDCGSTVMAWNTCRSNPHWVSWFATMSFFTIYTRISTPE
jgi:hypothetical protein